MRINTKKIIGIMLAVIFLVSGLASAVVETTATEGSSIVSGNVYMTMENYGTYTITGYDGISNDGRHLAQGFVIDFKGESSESLSNRTFALGVACRAMDYAYAYEMAWVQQYHDENSLCEVLMNLAGENERVIVMVKEDAMERGAPHAGEITVCQLYKMPSYSFYVDIPSPEFPAMDIAGRIYNDSCLIRMEIAKPVAPDDRKFIEAIAEDLMAYDCLNSMGMTGNVSFNASCAKVSQKLAEDGTILIFTPADFEGAEGPIAVLAGDGWKVREDYASDNSTTCRFGEFLNPQTVCDNNNSNINSIVDAFEEMSGHEYNPYTRATLWQEIKSSNQAIIEYKGLMNDANSTEEERRMYAKAVIDCYVLRRDV